MGAYGISYRLLEAIDDSGIVYPSLCTVKVPSTTQDPNTGQPVREWPTDLAGVIDVPCRKAPFIEDRPSNREVRENQQTTQFTQAHVIMKGYFSTILPEMRAVVDGVAYDILGVESD